jgi:hypothetical protein
MREVAINLAKLDFSVETIAQATGQEVDVIKRMIEKESNKIG